MSVKHYDELSSRFRIRPFLFEDPYDVVILRTRDCESGRRHCLRPVVEVGNGVLVQERICWEMLTLVRKCQEMCREANSEMFASQARNLNT